MLDTNIQDIAIGITVIDNQIYQWSLEKKQSHYTLAAINLSDLLTLWHKQMGHLAIDSLQKYLLRLEVSYTDDITTKYYCDTCQLAKATKQYTRILRPRPIIKYSEIHTDLVGPITPHGF